MTGARDEPAAEHVQTGTIRLNASRGIVWGFITTIDSISEWYDTWDEVSHDGVETRLRVGSTFVLIRHDGGADEVVQCRVTEMLAPARLEWVQTASHLPTTVSTFDLVANAEDTATEIRHTRVWRMPTQ